jgi:hypothetical protein
MPELANHRHARKQHRVRRAMKLILKQGPTGNDDLNRVTEIRILPREVQVTRLVRDENGHPKIKMVDGERELVTETECFTWHEPEYVPPPPPPDEPDPVLLDLIRKDRPFVIPRGHKAIYAEALLPDVGTYFTSKWALGQRIKMSSGDLSLIEKLGAKGWKEYKSVRRGERK